MRVLLYHSISFSARMALLFFTSSTTFSIPMFNSNSFHLEATLTPSLSAGSLGTSLATGSYPASYLASGGLTAGSGLGTALGDGAGGEDDVQAGVG
jgi:hypothetical protein